MHWLDLKICAYRPGWWIIHESLSTRRWSLSGFIVRWYTRLVSWMLRVVKLPLQHTLSCIWKQIYKPIHIHVCPATVQWELSYCLPVMYLTITSVWFVWMDSRKYTEKSPFSFSSLSFLSLGNHSTENICITLQRNDNEKSYII